MTKSTSAEQILTPLRRWADHRMGELTEGRLTTAWLTRPAVDALAVLCHLKPMDLVRRLPRRDPA